MKVLSNDSMRLNRLERHLKQQHPTLVLKARDGAPAMIGVRSGLAKYLKEKNPPIVSTHCVIHRQTLTPKTLMYGRYAFSHGRYASPIHQKCHRQSFTDLEKTSNKNSLQAHAEN
nr:unnamed protein product [Callosobruchus analis]